MPSSLKSCLLASTDIVGESEIYLKSSRAESDRGTFASDHSTPILEIFEEVGRRVVLEVDERSESDGAIQTEPDKPGEYDHNYYNHTQHITHYSSH